MDAIKVENLCNPQIYLGFLTSGRIGSFPPASPHKCFQFHQHGTSMCVCVGGHVRLGKLGMLRLRPPSVLESQYWCFFFFSPLRPTEVSREWGEACGSSLTILLFHTWWSFQFLCGTLVWDTWISQ